MKTILLTGASGFIGKNLQSYLGSKGFSAIGLSLRSFPHPNLAEKYAIVHLAGKAHDLKKVTQPEEYYQVNYELTKSLYDEFLKSDTSKFIFISSVKASADQVTGALKEEDLPNPQTHYGKSKLQAEEYIISQPLPIGKSYYILRPCMIHGPGNKGNLNLLYKLISKRIPYPLASFENKRSFLSIENLCFVINELLVQDNIPSGIYQVADDEALSTNELIKLIASASGKKPLLWNVNPHLIRYLAKLGDKLRLPLTTERLTKLTESYLVDNTKIKNVLKKGLPVKAGDGIIRTIRAYSVTHP